MGHMVRLGLWGPGTTFPTFKAFHDAVEKKHSIALMMLVAMEMKARGCYVSRMLSYEAAAFEMQRVPLASHAAQQYEGACALWANVLVRWSYPLPAWILLHRRISCVRRRVSALPAMERTSLPSRSARFVLPNGSCTTVQQPKRTAGGVS
jgi:P-loop containing NTP hydrolase pore-1